MIQVFQDKHRCRVCGFDQAGGGWAPASQPVQHTAEHLEEMARQAEAAAVPAQAAVIQLPAPAVEPIALNTITQGNCLDLLPRVASGSVDMVLTSPPYDNLRTYKGYSFDFEGVARELWRVVKPGGVVVWVVGDASVNGSETGTSFRQALHFKEVGFRLHDTMIYEKQNPMPVTNNRYQPAFEYMFVLSNGSPKTFNPIKVPALGITGGSKQYTVDGGRKERWRKSEAGFPDKLRTNIWTYTVGNEKTGHPAVYPLQLAIDHVASWSNPGDVVLDPFFGSGTTGVACQQLGRKFIGLEISPEYADIARKRLESLTGAAALGVAA